MPLDSVVDREDSSQSEPKTEPTNARKNRKRLALPGSWGQASKADKQLVAMMEKGEEWCTIQSAYERAIRRRRADKTLMKRYKRLVEIRNQATIDAGIPSIDMDFNESNTTKDGDGHRRQKELEYLDVPASEVDDGNSIYEISHDETEDEDISMMRCDSPRGPIGVHQSPAHDTSLNGPTISTFAARPNIATDPEKMLAAMQEGEKKWPEIRDAWEKATDRTTTIGDLAKQGSATINPEDVGGNPCLTKYIS